MKRIVKQLLHWYRTYITRPCQPKVGDWVIRKTWPDPSLSLSFNGDFV
jgi:hypothetical protein